MVEQNGWSELIKANPDHSAAYIERFEKMDAAGDDLAGEARFIDAMAPRSGRILDASSMPAAAPAASVRFLPTWGTTSSASTPTRF